MILDTITVEIQDSLDLPVKPGVLCGIAQTFDAAGYTKLGRYLRGCADLLTAKPTPAEQSLRPYQPIGLATCVHRLTAPEKAGMKARHFLMVEVSSDTMERVAEAGRLLLAHESSQG